jgi:excisionase family DNA binding protein
MQEAIVVSREELRQIVLEILAAEAPAKEAPGEIVDTATLAGRLNLTPQTIRAWAKRRKIPVLRTGRRPRFDYNRVLQALENAKK